MQIKKNNQWNSKELNITEQLEDLLGESNSVYGDGKDIRDQLIDKNDKSFFEKLLQLFRLTLQMRNSITNSDVDYLISPVKNLNGEFYDSRTADSSLPKDVDTNGAYHIAKKGLWWLQQINQYQGSDWRKLALDKSNKGWLKFVQG